MKVKFYIQMSTIKDEEIVEIEKESEIEKEFNTWIQEAAMSYGIQDDVDIEEWEEIVESAYYEIMEGEEEDE